MIIKKEGESEREIRYWQDSILEETKLIGSSREMWLQMYDYLFFFKIREGEFGEERREKRCSSDLFVGGWGENNKL